ncbi:YcxB family protein [Brevundimonas sp. Root1279]|uniref:YcxB family protein n=1 Tax=Brevundimonas sp. Root1279 TaxID=1736443 RepID=UPI0006F2A162|nr:YcxB family protein [Brevundimonas sp. Root1279]KQW86694.1 hypothetical protein ASC65_02070 [Brevundimonas sp. Root1279]
MIEIKVPRPVPEAERPPRALGALRWTIGIPGWITYAVPWVLIVATLLLSDDRRLHFVLLCTVVAAFVLRRLALAVVRRAAQAEWRKSPTWALANTWRLDDDGISFGDGFFLTSVRWEAIILVREEQDRFLFQGTPISAFALPIRFLDAGANQIDQIRALVAKVTAEGRLGRGVD